ncbi:alpha hydrolase-9 [Coleophoma crateriformis]|uniref:Alpha hydrolase-9 n=1 Tax=Coleophoma crateriformis TaxID=565419 RepID=A0A3D8QIX1_9HELO|nr:alpha hydrolase-9 [Coleophoma crateriformis]
MTTHQTAETRYIDAAGTKLAYRYLNPTNSARVPLVMQIHFRGNMDFWDPALINALSQSRPIILFDNAGIGKSSGEIPTTLKGWGMHIINLVAALKIKEIDLLGFSMGGGAVQMAALTAPGLVRRLILAGTRLSVGPNTEIGDQQKYFVPLATSVTDEEFKKSYIFSFYNDSPSGCAAGEASWARIMSRTTDRSPHLSPELARRQIEAWSYHSNPNPENSYERVHELTMPVFVANGDNDTLLPTSNSVEAAKDLPNAHLHIYPDSGHGFLFQYAELFAKHVDLFLDGPGAEVAKL